MTKLASDKVAVNRLNKYVETNFTEEQQDNIGYGGDIIEEDFYIWDCMLDGQCFEIRFNRKTMKIVSTYKGEK